MLPLECSSTSFITDILLAISRTGCHLCTNAESHWHSYVGEIGAGCWGIAKNKIYLWDKLCYWMCNMKSTGIIFEYTRPVHALQRWPQELMVYDCLLVHQPQLIMADVDTLYQGLYYKILNDYNVMSNVVRRIDTVEHLDTYYLEVFDGILKRGSYSMKGIK